MVKNTTDFFWTDLDQAQRRLTGTVVLYDGQPCYVREVRAPDDVGSPRGYIISCADKDQKAVRKDLNSPKFGRFRTLPNLGWMNSASRKEAGAVLLARRNRVTQQHGLTVENVTVMSLTCNSQTGDASLTSIYNFGHFQFDKGFVDAHNDHFPALEKVLTNIANGTAIAISRKLCVIRDGNGIRWMFHGPNRCGIFVDANTLMLMAQFSYLREEIMQDAAFTCNNIREF